MVPLAVFGTANWALLVFSMLVSVIVVALGTYLGVTLALQSFFGASSWEMVAEERS